MIPPLRRRFLSPALALLVVTASLDAVTVTVDYTDPAQTPAASTYALANPLRFTDPSGRFVQTVTDNSYSVLEVAVTVHPLGAALVFGCRGRICASTGCHRICHRIATDDH